MNWSEEIRKFIEEKVRELEMLKAIEDLEKVIRTLPEVPRGTATSMVRGDRDSH